jgi:hypothetical protein
MPNATPHTVSRAIAQQILQRLGQSGQPPEIGIEHLNVGNERLLDVLDREYLEPIATNGHGSSFKLVQGWYGAGKSHFLYVIRQRAWTHGLCAAIVALSPTECPFDNQADIYRAVAREVSAPPLVAESPPVRGIARVLTQFFDDRLQQLGQDGFRDWLRNLRRAEVDCQSWLNAAIALGGAIASEDDDTAELASAWLRGEEVLLPEVKHLQIRETLGRSTGFRMVRSLCQVLQAVGSPGLVLGFDEADRVLSHPPKKQRAIADNLRELIDLCGQARLPGLFCLYAVPPEFFTTIVKEYPALQQRLSGPTTLSERSPQAATIDLERLDLGPQAMLVAIGRRITELCQVATDHPFDDEIQRHNLTALAAALVEASYEVGHRRAFVKCAVQLLYEQQGDERELSDDEIALLAGRAAHAEAVTLAAEEF